MRISVVAQEAADYGGDGGWRVATLVAAAPLALSDVSGEVLNSTRSVTASQF
ncbi:MAG TPA: hypothetical protein PK027_05200 [Aquimonas sp.]|nr:hypothetical protein [Aquimonas sp.]HRF53842.1 hypothetical protein [Aquimonas sp.]